MRTRRGVLPGFGLSTGFTVLYLSLVVLLPLSTIVLKTSTLSWEELWRVVSSPRALASYRLSLGASLAAAGVNAVFGVLVAWVLVRYRFPGRSLVDAVIDSGECGTTPTTVVDFSSGEAEIIRYGAGDPTRFEQ